MTERFQSHRRKKWREPVGRNHEKYDPIKSPFFWVRFYTPKLDEQGRWDTVTTQCFFERKVRMTPDLVEAASEVAAILDPDQTPSSLIFDSRNREITDQYQNVFVKEINNRYNDFQRRATLQDWENRDSARKLEMILDQVPKGIRLSETEYLEKLLGKTQAILAQTPTTPAFQTSIIEQLKYIFTHSARKLRINPTTKLDFRVNLQTIGLDLDHNRFDLFDPEKTEVIERKAFAVEKAQAVASAIGEDRIFCDHLLGDWQKQFRIRYGKELV